MQVGDLVTLSAAGNKNKGNDLVIEKMGVIVEIADLSISSGFPYTIHWFNVPALGCSRGLLRMKRYEIKKV